MLLFAPHAYAVQLAGRNKDLTLRGKMVDNVTVDEAVSKEVSQFFSLLPPQAGDLVSMCPFLGSFRHDSKRGRGWLIRLMSWARLGILQVSCREPCSTMCTSSPRTMLGWHPLGLRRGLSALASYSPCLSRPEMLLFELEGIDARMSCWSVMLIDGGVRFFDCWQCK